jgi:hypothetical protein
METGREPAARRVLERLEKDLSDAAVLTRLYTGMIASEPVTDPANP